MEFTHCPCGQGQYSSCCEPLHLGKAKAETAEQLMRSRYSAFAKQQVDYIVATTAIGQQAQLDRAALLSWSIDNAWQQLEILNSVPRVDASHAMVEFKAYYSDGQARIHHEQSYFVKHQNAWYFIDPTLQTFPSMKHACLCGSEKKFKHCCATFIR
ncbi:YchJ family protein [Acinetobacter sp. MD2(2019)]|nr:YchJ family protein [Acinetobacter sp. MD2(2019)]MEB3753287.1 YchJ family protein [Acinetobacter sp. MD2(2019)]